MTLSIAQRFHPFSHTLGSLFLIPGTSWTVKIYPTRLIFSEIDGKKTIPIDLEIPGPVKGFTAELDLEKGLLKVWGETTKGFMRYKIFADGRGIWMEWEKGSDSKEKTLLIECPCFPFKSSERLSLGLHKAQDWEKMKARLDLKELFPLWLRIAEGVPQQQSETSDGMFALLDQCREAIVERRKTDLFPLFTCFFQAAFEGVFVPRLEDTEFQGIVPAKISSATTGTLSLLTESAKLIRSLFLEENDKTISLLSCLPPEFHCGRWLGRINSLQLNIEWTKKCLRRVCISSEISQRVTLKLPKGLISCRSAKLKKVSIGKDQLLHLELAPHTQLWLDRFEN